MGDTGKPLEEFEFESPLLPAPAEPISVPPIEVPEPEPVPV